MADPRPFLKWAGGKRTLVPDLLKLAPPTFGTYFEPFLGGGALFFALKPAQAVLSDMNLRLVRTYQGIRDDVERVIELWHTVYMVQHTPEFYDKNRAAGQGDEHAVPPAFVAAWFLYYNRFGFNGLYRVNRSGVLNVPLGRFKTPPTLDEDNLRACTQALNGVSVRYQDFRHVEQQAQPGDFVYFDPPYAPLSKSSKNFTSYTAGDFGPADQIALRDMARRMKDRGVHVLLSNSSADAISKLYGTGFEIAEVDMRRNINSKADARGAVKEFLIR